MSENKSKIYNKFIENCAKKSFDVEHRERIKYNISRYENAFNSGKALYNNIELAKRRAAICKTKVLNELDKYLIEFEANFITRGGKVIWAKDSKDVIKEVLSIARKYGARRIIKSKSMVTEEVGINEILEKNGIETIETDLGEFIVQIDNDKPYHIVTPAMHKSKKDIALLFNKKYNIDPNSTPEEITLFVRNLLRDKFTSADIGITGCNFLIADIGGVCLTENEGNGLLSTSFPQVHIVITGIEKILPSLKDLDLFWPLLATHGTGQHLTVYNSIFTGPRQENEIDGPVEMYVILLDNNRTNLLAQLKQRRALSCIRCGACLNFCPIYKNIGGHSYGSTYSGPIGAVITPWLKDLDDFQHLSFASSLCGKCIEVCPVNIPLHNLLLYNRRDIVANKLYNKQDKFVMFAYKHIMLRRKLIEKVNSKLKNRFISKFFNKYWGPRRELPKFAEKSFNKMWTEQREVR
ncbi:MAG TPA: LutB/LldF family L-lactate oxidation iron-sulfur protein [Bacteroidales bacterium]|nr:LutB/LldF family L-lactate oxidation iron-sulfur protein [Bacteroidales bacterium]